MASDRPSLTPEGKERLERELEELRHKRNELLERLRRAREAAHGDSEEMGESMEIQWEQARLEARIADLERLLARAQVVEAPPAGGVVGLGSSVVIKDEDGQMRYTLVEVAEADPRRGFISVESPVGRALVGRKPGDVIEVDAPAGRQRLELLAVE